MRKHSEPVAQVLLTRSTSSTLKVTMYTVRILTFRLNAPSVTDLQNSTFLEYITTTRTRTRTTTTTRTTRRTTTFTLIDRDARGENTPALLLYGLLIARHNNNDSNISSRKQQQRLKYQQTTSTS